uniref:Uncharacterized protein n=1 Tax=Panagrolaimus davidi TaxID=227884 RepID=A0A914Q011_9BILA
MLTDKVKFLQFINNMPDVLLGLITGLLPVVALAILMALVPVFIRLIANLAGFLTIQDLEAFCHSWYYAFQVIQTFLVVTIASAATSAITSVINKPESALTILGEKVPPASNFYIANTCYQIYVQEPNITDNRGKFYPRALMQLFTGIYLGELCLVALFVFKKNWATVVLEIVWIVVTAAVHIYLTWKYVPLFDAVPLSAIKYASGDSSYLYPYHDHGSSEIKFVGQNYWKADNRFNVSYSDQALIDLPNTTNMDINAPQRLSPINWLIKFFNPKKETFELIRSMMPRAYFKYVEYFPAFIDTAYYDPVVSDEKPVIWIAKDNMGLSDIEMEKAQQFGVDISNDNATLDENGDIILSGFPPSYKAPLKV